MRRLLLVATVCIAFSAQAQELQSFVINADDWAEGDPPKEVFVVDGTIKIAAREGNKAIVIDPNPITDASAQLAVSANGHASIEAKILAIKRGRSTPRFGVSVHGMSGYRLIVNPAKKTLDLVKSDQTLVTVPFNWMSEVWVHVKLAATKGDGDAWIITGSAWPAEAVAPADPMIKFEDKTLKTQGKCAIWATPFSGEPVFFDDIHISVAEATAP